MKIIHMENLTILVFSNGTSLELYAPRNRIYIQTGQKPSYECHAVARSLKKPKGLSREGW